MATWNEQLRELRRGRSRTPSDLAACSGISQSSIRSYELGRRHPTREHLSRLLDCLGADAPARNVILADAGFASAVAVGTSVETSVPEKEAVQLLHRRPWPAFLVNHRADVLAVNAVAQRFLGLPPARPGAPYPSILTFATRRALASKCENWDMAVIVMIRGFKAGNPQAGTLDTPSPAFTRLLEAVCAGDPALVAKFTELWSNMPPWRGPFAGVVYETIWKGGGRQRIRFDCAINCVNAEAGLYFHDWIPADSTSFRLLEKQLAGQADSS
jgi:transcriptional regulator with XRE-family HTH domain